MLSENCWVVGMFSGMILKFSISTKKFFGMDDHEHFKTIYISIKRRALSKDIGKHINLNVKMFGSFS